MFTAKALNDQLCKMHVQLIELGFRPDKMILFGSYANGNPHRYSDVDIAIWNKNFSGSALNDMELVKPLIKNFRKFDIKFYPSGATSENFDPFIEVIEQTGKQISFHD